MSTLSQFSGGSPTTSIVNFYSSGGVNSEQQVGASAVNGAREVLSGALTAATLATALAVTGAGEVPALSIFTKNSTSRTLRLRVTVDGTVVFDSTSNAITSSGYGMVAVGTAETAGMRPAPSPIKFNASLLVEIASSLSETDLIAIAYILNKR